MRNFTGALVVGALCFWGAVSLGQTADFDGHQEGAIGRDFVENGIRFYEYDNRLDPPGSMMVAERADETLTGQPGFTVPNALGFGGYSPGGGAAFGRFGSVRIEPASGTATSATIHIYDFGNNGGLTLTLDATLGGNLVDSAQVTLQDGFYVKHNALSIEGIEFDSLFLHVGPTEEEFAFILADTVTLGSGGGGFVLDDPSPGFAGMDNTLAAHGAGPGHRVYFIYGLRTGQTNVPGCQGVTVGIAGPTVAGSDVADAMGDAELRVFVPGAARGRTVYLQAVDRAACEVSNRVGFVFQ